MTNEYEELNELFSLIDEDDFEYHLQVSLQDDLTLDQKNKFVEALNENVTSKYAFDYFVVSEENTVDLYDRGEVTEEELKIVEAWIKTRAEVAHLKSGTLSIEWVEGQITDEM